MPELPEVEVTCQGLRPHIVGKRIEAIWYSNKKLRHPFSLRFAQEQLLNTRVQAVNRRAKYIIIETVPGATIIFHLGMTGNIGIFDKMSSPIKHDHLILSLDDEMEMRFNDVRRFGSIQVLSPDHSVDLEDTQFKNLGVEPLKERCNAKYLFEAAKGKKVAVKTMLMDNRIVVGIGNIYANETLFRAGIKPQRPAKSIRLKEWNIIYKELVATLHWAIQCGGSTISDFQGASGESGYFQANFKVYGKEGHPCQTCSTPVTKTVIGGRATFHCSHCQL